MLGHSSFLLKAFLCLKPVARRVNESLRSCACPAAVTALAGGF